MKLVANISLALHLFYNFGGFLLLGIIILLLISVLICFLCLLGWRPLIFIWDSARYEVIAFHKKISFSSETEKNTV